MAVVNHGFASFAFIFLLAFAMIIVPVVLAEEKVNSGIANFDEFYKEKADHAMDEAVKSFEPHPEKITEEFNKQVGAELSDEHAKKH